MWGKESKCHICQVIYTPYENVAFIISAPYLLRSCMEKICANSLFSSSVGDK